MTDQSVVSYNLESLSVECVYNQRISVKLHREKAAGERLKDFGVKANVWFVAKMQSL